ncbi:hypothetical protein PQI66_07175 [Corynebacterium sp. USCH3]|uniref:hypothetical protein n=1 Tax=Corynebacterium sp. USCH3 TaxID=3024840 RepID=UPI0030B39380
MSVLASVTSAVRRYHRQVHGGVREQPIVWFRVHVPHPRLWDDRDSRGGDVAEPVVFDAATRQRLADGLRIGTGPDSLVTAVAPAPRATSTVERSYAGVAALLRMTAHSLVGVPAPVADRMRWAAAGCGLLASRLDGLPLGARVRTPAEDASGPLQVTALPGWMIGTDVYGVPVVLHLPPGTTTLLRGRSAATVSRTIPPSGRVLGDDVVLVGSPTEWEDAWHPQRCRVMVDTGADADLAAGLSVDLTVDFTAGTVSTGGVTVGFTPLPLRS